MIGRRERVRAREGEILRALRLVRTGCEWAIAEDVSRNELLDRASVAAQIIGGEIPLGDIAASSDPDPASDGA
jgi:hypothetical protein